jgi:diacylglycerol O-acyltransferase / wax synthase
MTGVETLMWRLERFDRRLSATMSLVVRLDGRVPVDGLVDQLSSMCASVPRLADRVQESPLGLAPPVWERDPLFSVENHMGALDGPLWEVAAEVVAMRFPPGRPPWRAVVASSSPETLILHLHHSYTDGLGGVRLLAELFDGPPGGSHSGAAAESTRPDSSDRPGPSMVGEISGEIGRAVQLWARAVPWAVRTLDRARSDPAQLLDQARATLAALQGQAGAASGPASPVLAGRSAEVYLAPLDLELAALRATSRRLGVTINDVFLAALLDGLARYHSKHGSVAPSLRLAVPISNRSSEVEMHNQILGTVLRGPLGALDFDERARLIHEMVAQGRHQPWAALIEELASGAVRVPGLLRLVAAAVGGMDVLASNVVGPPMPMSLCGIPIRSMTPIGPRTGSALNVTLLSYCSTASLGINIDPAAVSDPEVLFDCLSAGFDDHLAG